MALCLLCFHSLIIVIIVLFSVPFYRLDVWDVRFHRQGGVPYTVEEDTAGGTGGDAIHSAAKTAGFGALARMAFRVAEPLIFHIVPLFWVLYPTRVFCSGSLFI